VLPWAGRRGQALPRARDVAGGVAVWRGGRRAPASGSGGRGERHFGNRSGPKGISIRKWPIEIGRWRPS
jgi:hypothetical protein